MDIERTFTVAAPRQDVWAFITSPARVGPCLPGCENVEVLGEGRYRAVIGVKVGPIKTSFNVEVEAAEERAPEFARYVTRGEEGGKASRISADSTLALEEREPAVTAVTYTSKINIVGRLGKFAGGVMKKIADSISDEFIANIRRELEPPSDAPAPAAEAGVMAKVSGIVGKVFGRDDAKDG